VKSRRKLDDIVKMTKGLLKRKLEYSCIKQYCDQWGKPIQITYGAFRKEDTDLVAIINELTEPEKNLLLCTLEKEFAERLSKKLMEERKTLLPKFKEWREYIVKTEQDEKEKTKAKAGGLMIDNLDDDFGFIPTDYEEYTFELEFKEETVEEKKRRSKPRDKILRKSR